jgi:DNA-binding NtrC family response regulator
VIAATSRDLAVMVTEGRFRADLYYRLNVLPIRLPPLRERLGDIEALSDVLLEDIARRSGLTPKSLSAGALDRLANHAWPGNIRELRNALEQAALMVDDLVLQAVDLNCALGLRSAEVEPGVRQDAGARLRRQADSTVTSVPVQPSTSLNKPLPQAVAELEALAIQQALEATQGNKVAAARLLGIARATLYEKLQLMGGTMKNAGKRRHSEGSA